MIHTIFDPHQKPTVLFLKDNKEDLVYCYHMWLVGWSQRREAWGREGVTDSKIE